MRRIAAAAQSPSETGDYVFNLLPIGAYSVKIELTGFKTQTTRMEVATGDRARMDAQVQVGEVSQSIEVAAEVTALQTDNSTVGGLVTSQAVQDLPVNGRNFIRLVQLAPEATESVQSSLGGGTRPDDRRQTSTVSANGQTDSSNNFLLDGMDNNERAIATIIVKPSIDALQEVKVDSNMYSAGTAQQNSVGITQDRPNLVAAQAITQNINQWIDISQFRRQPFGSAGNEGHNVFNMPSNKRIDLSIFKDFPITESTKLQFRAEGFNITNTPLFGMPGNVISTFDSTGVPTNAGNFGRITTTNAFYTPRDIQLALKLIF